VAARRLVIVMLVLLGVSTLAAALVPVERDSAGDETTTTATETGKDAEPTGDLLRQSIDADARKPKTIVMSLGDQLELAVRSCRADQAEIAALGELEDVHPDAPARFDLLPFATGTYAVRLVDADRRVGEIEVRPKLAAKDQRKGPKRSPC
jgi:hypothetical protein